VSGYTGTTNGTVSVYSRDLTDGSLTHLQTRREGEIIAIFPTTRFLDGLAGAHALALSPDGANLYVAGLHDNSLVIFRRDQLSGKLTYLLTEKDGAQGMDGLGGTTSVTLDSSGTHLYTTALTDQALGLFDRDPETGLLTFVETFKRDTTSGLPALDGANDVTISPDGTTVYTVAGIDDALTAFAVANPQATLESLLPASAQEGAGALTLVIKGKNFVGGSQIVWNGSPRSTTYISTGELRTPISAADLASAGSATVKIANPAPGGGDSANALTFTISAPGQNPQPSIDYITPQSVAAEVTEFTLTVVGANFVQGAVVRYNGVNRPTTFVDSSHLTAQIGAPEVLAALAAQDPDLVSAAAVDANQPAGVTVQNPPPGGGTSNAVLFTVLEAGQNPAPSLTQLQPATTIEQGPSSGGLTVQVQGANFLEAAQAYWNGTPRTTKFVSETQLTVTLLGSDLAFAGSGSLSVVNPAPGGGESNGLIFTVTATPLNPTPTISKLTPDTILGQGLSTPPTIDVSGSNFLPSAGVYWDGVLRPTHFIDSGHLQFTLTMTDVVSADTGAIVVINPPPGGGASQEKRFTVYGYGLYLPAVMQ
jgi:hypothetical protein